MSRLRLVGFGCVAVSMIACAGTQRRERSTVEDWVKLFGGNDYKGWVAQFEQEGAVLADAFTVNNGVMICDGSPQGYIRTTNLFRDFELELEWRFDPGHGGGNTGVLLRVVGEDKVWPKSVEVQLESGNAGDIWIIDGYPVTVDPSRTEGRRTRRSRDGAELPLGQWNQASIRVADGVLTVSINGTEVNRATGLNTDLGKIALQSEGAHVEFRNIRINPVDINYPNTGGRRGP